jgi:hypothetical protein
MSHGSCCSWAFHAYATLGFDIPNKKRRARALSPTDDTADDNQAHRFWRMLG